MVQRKTKVAEVEKTSHVVNEQKDYIVKSISEELMEEMDVEWFVVDTDVETERDNVNTFILQNKNAETFIAEIPETFHYSLGDAVSEKHIYNERCTKCGNDKIFDNRNEEWYCPVNHDD